MVKTPETILWADGTTCSYEELEEFLQFMSDDYEVITNEPDKHDLEEMKIDAMNQEFYEHASPEEIEELWKQSLQHNNLDRSILI